LSTETVLPHKWPVFGRHERAAGWLRVWTDLGRAPRTIDAYARGRAEYLTMCDRTGVDPLTANRAHIAVYVRELTSRPSHRGANVISIDSGSGLANATIQQRLVRVRLFYDYLMEEGLRESDPVGRGRYTPGRARARTGPQNDEAAVVPTEQHWLAILDGAPSDDQPGPRPAVSVRIAAQSRPAVEPVDVVEGDPAHRARRRGSSVLHPHHATPVLNRSGPEGLGVARDATFADHRNTGSTLTYIHLSGRDLAAKLNRGMEQIHGWRGGLTMTALLQTSAVATDAARSWSWPVRPVRYDRHPEFTATEREALVCLGTDLRRRTGGYDAQASQWETVGRLLRHSTSCAHRCGFPMAAGTAVGSTTPSPWFSCGLSSTAGRSGPGRPRIGSP
jgi:hypothetical protein